MIDQKKCLHAFIKSNNVFKQSPQRVNDYDTG